MMLPLNMIGFIKIVPISPKNTNIQTLIKIIKTQKILVADVTANIVFEKTIPSNTQ